MAAPGQGDVDGNQIGQRRTVQGADQAEINDQAGFTLKHGLQHQRHELRTREHRLGGDADPADAVGLMSNDHASAGYGVRAGSATVRDVTLPDDALAAACEMQRLSRGGPGGQHANKTASTVRLTHRASGLVVEASEFRDSGMNRAAALRRLRIALACAYRGGAESAWLHRHVHGGRLRCGPQAASWPGVVAVLLDLLAIHHGALSGTAAAAGLSTTQLAKALVADPQVRRVADAIRGQAGLGALRA